MGMCIICGYKADRESADVKEIGREDARCMDLDARSCSLASFFY